ncbi:hypothetical protein HS1genome_1100 [Sulfodiicoccus acidiphilus]|uniref:RING-type domain-containing protein n=1 Tax=Sulfodiicoccus acidiphilus TaxID=1670455 RepID=A0A348B3F9_9CREN|nr:hypothetical protein [Sulfodiicoccus acidiphilus]BBD72711.1 hypothetical protein HS1genome_1100 [Sulfodiicoccus acidiphilus]GGT95358.1 hypothetical protein GCM10007116_11070 [Sulfodiicoccus acidiphilus]
MSLRIKGTNSHGSLGWFEVNCRICNTTLRIGTDLVYVCPKDEKRYHAYFCEACKRGVKGKCPYCSTELVTVI